MVHALSCRLVASPTTHDMVWGYKAPRTPSNTLGAAMVVIAPHVPRLVDCFVHRVSCSGNRCLHVAERRASRRREGLVGCRACLCGGKPEGLESWRAPKNRHSRVLIQAKTRHEGSSRAGVARITNWQGQDEFRRVQRSISA